MSVRTRHVAKGMSRPPSKPGKAQVGQGPLIDTSGKVMSSPKAKPPKR